MLERVKRKGNTLTILVIMSQRDGTGREVGGGLRMGNTCIPMYTMLMCGKTNTIL